MNRSAAHLTTQLESLGFASKLPSAWALVPAGVLAAAAVLAATVIAASGLEVKLSEFAPFIALAAAMGLVAAYAHFRKLEQRFVQAAAIVAVGTLSLLLCGLISNVGLRLRAPTIDATLARMDEIIGWDVSVAVPAFTAHPWLIDGLAFVYNLSGPVAAGSSVLKLLGAAGVIVLGFVVEYAYAVFRYWQDRRWTAKVTDVRNWFLFAASERWREDDSEHEHYSDSGGKSGGQKEKLAYTILAASLAYQFGLEWGAVRSRSFRFVVIDEAFGRGSDESAQYGLRLFEQLNLQLLIVTPLQKIHIIEPFVASVGFVHNEGGRDSRLRCLSIEEYRAQKEAGASPS